MTTAYPHDRDDFDRGLRAYLAYLRKGPLYTEPNVAEQALLDRLEAAGDMPDSVRAWAHTVRTHAHQLDFDWFILDGPDAFEDHGQHTIIAPIATEAGIDLSRSAWLGRSGGGEDQLLLTWTGEGYALWNWAMQEGELNPCGSFDDWFVDTAESVIDSGFPDHFEDDDDDDDDDDEDHVFPVELDEILKTMDAWDELRERF